MLLLKMKRNNPPQKTQGKQNMEKTSFKTQLIEWALKMGRPVTWTELHKQNIRIHGFDIDHMTPKVYHNSFRGFGCVNFSLGGNLGIGYFMKASRLEGRHFSKNLDGTYSV